jgi:uncharacterized membrane protein
VQFRPAPGGRGTEVHVELRYDVPGGRIGQALARLTGREPRQEVGSDLRRLKQVLETGEAVLSETTLQGRGFRQPPAQPPQDITQVMTATGGGR